MPRVGSKRFNCNFGVLGICDWLYGTRGNYDEWHDKWEVEREAELRRQKEA
jgi:hypothetical protein